MKRILIIIVMSAAAFAAGLLTARSTSRSMAEAAAESALPASPLPAPSQSVVARVHKPPAPSMKLTPRIEGLVQRAQSDPAAAVTAWDVLSWCDGQEQKRLDNAKGQIESGRRRVERFGTGKARQRLRDAEQWHAEVESQVELCSPSVAANRRLLRTWNMPWPREATWRLNAPCSI